MHQMTHLCDSLLCSITGGAFVLGYLLNRHVPRAFMGGAWLPAGKGFAVVIQVGHTNTLETHIIYPLELILYRQWHLYMWIVYSSWALHTHEYLHYS